MAQRRNVLLVVFDQFRADLLHGALAGHVHLPNLQAFRRTATTFRRHYTVAAPCGPARASLFTGQYAMNHRSVRNGTPLRHDTPNLATQLRARGYDPLMFGYTDITQDPRVLPADDPRLTSYEEVLPGFTEALRLRQDTDVICWTDHLTERGYRVPEGHALYRPDGPEIDSPAIYRAEDSDTAFLTDRLLARLDGAAPGWCATACFIRPHPPFVAPAPYNTMFSAADIPAARHTADRRGDRGWHPFLAPTQDRAPISSTVSGFPDLVATQETVGRIRALYCGLAAEVDHHFGRIMDWLDTSGQASETVVVVTSDHGEMLGDFGLWGKGTFHDSAFHVPLLVRDPASPDSHGRRTDAMTESVDVMPTILDLVGAEVPASVDGLSLRPFLEGESTWPKRHSVSELDFGNPLHPTAQQSALGLASVESGLMVYRTDRHRLVHFAADLPQILFDMEGAGEALDISGAPDAAETRARLTRAMLRHRMTHADRTFSHTLVADGGVRSGTC